MSSAATRLQMSCDKWGRENVWALNHLANQIISMASHLNKFKICYFKCVKQKTNIPY